MSAPGDAGWLCVGLISGTSADGIDAALVRIKGGEAADRLELIAFRSFPYPSQVRAELMALYAPDAPNAIARLCSLNVVVGELFAEAAVQVARLGGVAPGDLHVVGSHGQTVWHQPGPESGLPFSRLSTIQIGEASSIAERTGAPVVADFRVADIAAGGHGAPLVPYFDWVALRHPERARAIQNIGGIGNVTFLPPGSVGRIDEVRAFDTGPGNMVIDGVVSLLTGGAREFDADGALAAGGTVDAALLDRLLEDAYLALPPPKTTGREWYGLPFARNLLELGGVEPGVLAPDATTNDGTRQRTHDLIATATMLTARSIADAYRRWLPEIAEAIVGGGGSRNPTLMGMLGALLAPVPVTAIDAHGVDGRAKEAMAFALMAHDALAGLPTNVPGATGARQAVRLGKVSLSTSAADRPRGW